MLNTQRLLAFDPLSFAETNKTINSVDPELVLALSYLHAAIKKQHLRNCNDTTLSNTLSDYIAVITDIGFEQVLALPFQGTAKYGSTDQFHNEMMYIYIERETGILLRFDTYQQNDVNSGSFYYCWKPNDDVNNYNHVISSGQWYNYDRQDRSKMYWGGYHDSREAIRFHINQLKQNGTFITPWPKDNTMMVWLLHYQDTKQLNYDHKQITAERIEMLPQFAREIINR